MFLKNTLTVIISIIFTIILIELVYNFAFRDDLLTEKLDKISAYKNYSANEMDNSLPARHKFNGGECVERGLMTRTRKMNWHPRFGANDNKININCINNLFKKDTINIVFFGGSSMFNHEAPNYLTSIGYYALKDNFDKYRSVNLANSGARMSNNLSSFIEHVPKLNNVNHVVFFDGINEFTGVQLGSNPTYDTYWAQGVKARINSPEVILLEKLISKSLFFEIFFKHVLNYKSIRDKSNVKFATNENIELAAKDYTYRKKIIQIFCKELMINCLFILQPGIFFDETKKSYPKEVGDYYENLFGENHQ